MELEAYYRLISSEGKPRNTCWENASKTITDFALAASAENFTPYERGGIVALVAGIPSRSSPEGGSTRDE